MKKLSINKMNEYPTIDLNEQMMIKGGGYGDGEKKKKKKKLPKNWREILADLGLYALEQLWEHYDVSYMPCVKNYGCSGTIVDGYVGCKL